MPALGGYGEEHIYPLGTYSLDIGGHFSLDGTIYHSPRYSMDNLDTGTLEYIAQVHVLPCLQLDIINSSVII